MLSSAFHLFSLRELPWSRFHFPRWQALLGLALIAVLAGFDPVLRAAFPGMAHMPALSFGMAVASSALCILVCTSIIVGFLRWWMQRGGRWDGQGDLFNLFVASGLVANILSAGLIAVGMPILTMLPLWLYAFWVSGNALSGAIPKASLAYSIGGSVISLISALIVYGLAMVLIGLTLGSLDVALPFLQ